MKKLELYIACFLLLLSPEASAQLKPSWLFDDNAVLQQGIAVPVWGTASPGAKVTVSIDGTVSSVFADQIGKWKLYLPSRQADGTGHTLVIESEGEKKVCNNVKYGEVWVASGQSNMEYHIGDGILDYDTEVAAADYPDIRYFPVGLSPAAEQRTDGPRQKWVPVTPQTVLPMSAVSYYFARNLHLDRNVPVGIIVAARGATEIGTWISAEMLEKHPVYQSRVMNFDPEAWKQREREAGHHQALRDSIQQYSFNGLGQGVTRRNYDDAGWPEVTFPFSLWHLTGKDFWGIIWFRKHFNLTADQCKKDWTLKLPVTDVGDIQYVNGKEIGRRNSLVPEILEIPIPSSYLKKGDNVFGLRMTTTWGLCNVGNDLDNYACLIAEDGERIDLTGKWLFNCGLEPPMPLLSNYYNEPTVNFNGMIAPIAGYGIKGFIWYQGEGNTGYYPEEYANLKRMLIEDWRIRWKMGYLPFLYVQLANMNKHNEVPQDYDGWAVLRDKQTELLDMVPAVGMASAIDIGEWNNAHPLNKREVGRRLYLCAKSIAYGESAICSGPMLKEIRQTGNTLRLSYENPADGLKTSDGTSPRGFAVSDVSGKWQWVKAGIDGKEIVLDVAGINGPKRLQYGWQANPEVNLQNSEGLPAIPFNVEIPQYVPEPEAVSTGDLTIGAFRCPLWYEKAMPGCWDVLEGYPERRPVLGYYNEACPEVVDWEIKYALEHGISFFFECWFRAKDNEGKTPVEAVLDHWLQKGFFHSRYGDRMKFAILWENVNGIASGVSSKEDLIGNLMPYWIENFFSRANYLRVDGKPLMMIYDYDEFIKDLGGERNAAEAISDMKTVCKEAGLNGLYLMAEYHEDLSADLSILQSLGFDAVTSYHWPTFSGRMSGIPEHTDEIVEIQAGCWRKLAEKTGLPTVPTLSMGWDSRPWGCSYSKSCWSLTPAQYENLAAEASEFVGNSEESPVTGMILLDNWNEYGEGHYIFPTAGNGFGHLDAVRNAFSEAPRQHKDIIPSEIGLGPYTYDETEKQ